ncbi:hypothetical protein [Novosphingobium sp. PP1Y]|uniref:hypothetical protein n=1 Tax=Novosphingobium sp. PP1Y TaxID=702113 RepID=UPI00020EECDC|nr:hypothetical protein [Novosphingobium sp. PP1Y]CCA92627.1 hypothetical protein PP1Y_AT17468 [Novosphingobium sp. PP1Y]
MIETFWPWMFSKFGRRTGFRLLLNWWLLIDFIIAFVLTVFLKVDGFYFAGKALFPAASILVGMSVAWTARAATILNNDKFQERVLSEQNPMQDYIYGYQMSIMMLFGCIMYISIMSVGGFDFCIINCKLSRFISSFFMYFSISMTIRECWSVVNFTNLLVLLDNKVRQN